MCLCMCVCVCVCLWHVLDQANLWPTQCPCTANVFPSPKMHDTKKKMNPNPSSVSQTLLQVIVQFSDQPLVVYVYVCVHELCHRPQADTRLGRWTKTDTQFGFQIVTNYQDEDEDKDEDEEDEDDEDVMMTRHCSLQRRKEDDSIRF